MRNLISMTDFVIDAYDKIEDSLDSELAMYRYAMFLKQPLELWMFVFCDEDGNVLEEPKPILGKDFDYAPTGGVTPHHSFEFEEKLKQYEQARKKCLFEGFEIKVYNSQLQSINLLGVLDIYWKSKEYGEQWYLSKGLKNIEDLVKFKLELTQTAIKQLGL